MQTRASDEDYDHEVEANLSDEESSEFALISEVCMIIIMALQSSLQDLRHNGGCVE